MRKAGFIFIVSVLISVSVSGQDYKTGIGIRGGFGGGLTFKHFIQDDIALEGILVTEWGGFFVSGLYEIHKQAFNANRLNWYYGIGGHLGFGDFSNKHPLIDKSGTYNLIGIDGIIGIEYNISEIPINIGIDYKPVFEIVGKFGPVLGAGALSIRYIF